MSGPRRVASLISSSTEIVCALGLRERLVARSHECDHPPEVLALPQVTRPRLDASLSSAEIDRQVREAPRQALSIYDVDGERLRALAPEVVLTQVQCDVCAPSLRDVEAALEGWGPGGGRPRVVSLAPYALADVWEDVRRVAGALGEPARGERLVADLQARMARAGARADAALARAGGRRPRVALIEWLDPLMTAGNWMPELCARAGGECLFGRAGVHSPHLAWSELVAADPDVVVLLPCGFDLARTRAEAAALARRPEWRALRAVRAGRAVVCDGNAYFNRPGPRLVESLEALVEVLFPGDPDADLGLRGRAWEPL